MARTGNLTVDAVSGLFGGILGGVGGTKDTMFNCVKDYIGFMLHKENHHEIIEYQPPEQNPKILKYSF